MKKALAIAVASAFAVPAVAAEVSLNGVIEYHYDIADGKQDAANLNGDTPAFTVSATDELDNGMSVSGAIVWDGAFDSHNITIGGTPIGKIEIGDVSGALDATGDYTDIAPEVGGFGADGNDHFINVALPSFNGVQIEVSMSPEENNAGGAENAFGASVTYTTGNSSFYYGMEEAKTFGTIDDDTEIEMSAFGAKTTVAGIYLAYERGSLKEGTNEVDYTGLAASYKMGNVTIGMEKQETDVEGASFNRENDDTTADLTSSTVADADLQIGFIKYDFGGGLNTYVEVSSNDDSTTGDATVIGVKYSF